MLVRGAVEGGCGVAIGAVGGLGDQEARHFIVMINDHGLALFDSLPLSRVRFLAQHSHSSSKVLDFILLVSHRLFLHLLLEVIVQLLAVFIACGAFWEEKLQAVDRLGDSFNWCPLIVCLTDICIPYGQVFGVAALLFLFSGLGSEQDAGRVLHDRLLEVWR